MWPLQDKGYLYWPAVCLLLQLGTWEWQQFIGAVWLDMPMIYQTTGTIWACKTWGEAKTIKLCNQPWWAWYHTLLQYIYGPRAKAHAFWLLLLLLSCCFFLLFGQLFPLFKSLVYASFVQIEHVWEPKSSLKSVLILMHFLSLDLMVFFFFAE